MSGKDIAVLKATEKQQLKKSTENLLGICFGLIADRNINDQEVQMLSLWLSQHQCVTTVWPGNIIAQRVDAILEDGVITAAERQDLLETLQEIAGYEFDETGSAAAAVTAIPYCDQADILLDGGLFCFTGRFVYGKREKCIQETKACGGGILSEVRTQLHYLVVGSIVEPTWAHTSYGRKIEQAMQFNANGYDIKIISEQQWQQALRDFHTDKTCSDSPTVTACPSDDDSEMDVLFDGQTFCFTGSFEYGEREKCAQETIARGGSVVGGIKASLQYLVVGANGGGGSKVAMAMELKEKGRNIAIISERQWQQALLATKKSSGPAS